MADAIIKLTKQTIKVTLRGAAGPRGQASGPLGVGSVDAETVTDDTSEQEAIVAKLGASPLAVDYLAANGASVPADMAFGAVFPVSPTNMGFYGDSFTHGYVGSAPDIPNAYRTLVAARRGKTSQDFGLPGGSIMDITYPLMGTAAAPRYAVSGGDEAVALMGYNDQRRNGSDAVLVRSYRAALMAMSAWLTVPDSQKIFANDSRVSYSGTWSATTVRNGDWRFTETNGAYAEADVEGSAIYLVVLQQTVFGATVEVEVDGESLAVVDLGADIGNGGQLKWSGGVLDAGGVPLNFQPHCIRIAGLSRGKHTVRLTKLGGTQLHLGAIFTNGSAAKESARLYLGNPLRSSPAGAAIGTAPNLNYSDLGNRMHSEATEQVVRLLRSDGLDVRLVDANSAWDPIEDPASDDIHPPASGHIAIANAFVRAMDTTLPESAALGQLASLDPQDVAFQNGWSNLGGGHQEVQFAKSDGRVSLRGMATGGTVTVGTVLFTLPAGFRPAAIEYFGIVVSPNVAGAVSITPDGDVIAREVNAGWTSLSGITFAAA